MKIASFPQAAEKRVVPGVGPDQVQVRNLHVGDSDCDHRVIDGKCFCGLYILVVNASSDI